MSIEKLSILCTGAIGSVLIAVAIAGVLGSSRPPTRLGTIHCFSDSITGMPEPVDSEGSGAILATIRRGCVLQVDNRENDRGAVICTCPASL